MSPASMPTARLQDEAFAFIENDPFGGSAGELRFTESHGATYVYGDVNGDGEADFALELLGVSGTWLQSHRSSSSGQARKRGNGSDDNHMLQDPLDHRGFVDNRQEPHLTNAVTKLLFDFAKSIHLPRYVLSCISRGLE